MGIDKEARRMLKQERDMEEARVFLRTNLPLVMAVATHPPDQPINNPSLIHIARTCAIVVATPMLPPEEDE